MNLPNYFLADLQPEGTLSSTLLGEACQSLKRNRERYLAHRSTHNIIDLLSRLAEQWLQPDYPFRKSALEAPIAETGFPSTTIAKGLDSFFKQLTRRNLVQLLQQDLGHERRLDEMTSVAVEEASNRAAVVRGPELLVHIAAGNLPNPVLHAIALGFLTRSAQFVKCASGASFLPRLFAYSLYELEPKLGSCLELAEWRGGRDDLEKAVFEHANCVTATGKDETLDTIRQKLPIKTRFLGYGLRVSFAYVANGILKGAHTHQIVARAAAEVVAWNQQGCLSPHVIYVERGGACDPEQFAKALADELARCEETEPRGDVPTEAAAAIASRRSFYQVRAAHSPDTLQWCSPNSTAWTVVFESDPRFQLSCLNRFIYVKGVKDLEEALQAADGIREHASTVGLAAPEDQARRLATQLAQWGATRVCPLGQMQNPPLNWRHDGRPALADLVTWTDYELQ